MEAIGGASPAPGLSHGRQRFFIGLPGAFDAEEFWYLSARHLAVLAQARLQYEGVPLRSGRAGKTPVLLVCPFGLCTACAQGLARIAAKLRQVRFDPSAAGMAAKAVLVTTATRAVLQALDVLVPGGRFPGGPVVAHGACPLSCGLDTAPGVETSGPGNTRWGHRSARCICWRSAAAWR